MNSDARHPLLETFDDLPSPPTMLFGVIASAIVSYYLGEVVALSLGGPLAPLQSTSHLLIISAYLMASSLIGYLSRRIVLVALIFACVFGGLHLFAALNGSGPALPWIRNITVNFLWPMLNATVLLWFIRSVSAEPKKA